MGQAAEYKPARYPDHQGPQVGIHFSLSQDIGLNKSFISHNDIFSHGEENYLGRGFVTCPKQGTYTRSIKLLDIYSVDTCTAFDIDISKPFINVASKDRSDFSTEEKATQNLIEASSSIILASNSLLQNSKPLDGKPLDILNKTYKRLFKQTPTRL